MVSASRSTTVTILPDFVSLNVSPTEAVFTHLNTSGLDATNSSAIKSAYPVANVLIWFRLSSISAFVESYFRGTNLSASLFHIELITSDALFKAFIAFTRWIWFALSSISDILALRFNGSNLLTSLGNISFTFVASSFNSFIYCHLCFVSPILFIALVVGYVIAFEKPESNIPWKKLSPRSFQNSDSVRLDILASGLIVHFSNHGLKSVIITSSTPSKATSNTFFPYFVLASLLTPLILLANF